MPRRSRLALAKDEILSYFSKAPQKIYSGKELRDILSGMQRAWKLAESTSPSSFVTFLEEHGNLKAHEIRSQRYDRSIVRYSWGEPSHLALAQSMKSRGYLSHGSAAMLHGLTKGSPRTIYLNVEQSPKRSARGPLTQDGIERAFSGPQRQSNLIYEYGGISIIVIAGKHTNHLSVEETLGPASERLQATSVERTLIDIVVRPAYAGGLSQVMEAYRCANGRISIDRLSGILKNLDYAYPYHQAIGFLMQKTGHPEQNYAAMRALGLSYDFYLTHEMERPEYSSEWRLYYPRV